MKYRALNELLCAALINEKFRATLLNDPVLAVVEGYQGHGFSLTPEEHDLIIHIRATDLEDFAAQVYEWIEKDRRHVPVTVGDAIQLPIHNRTKEKSISVHSREPSGGHLVQNPVAFRLAYS